MAFHHILIDGASWRVVLDDLESLMAGRGPVPEADTLVLKNDAPLDFAPQKIDRTAERMDQLLERI